jgi:hypothetical protein
MPPLAVENIGDDAKVLECLAIDLELDFAAGCASSKIHSNRRRRDLAEERSLFRKIPEG